MKCIKIKRLKSFVLIFVMLLQIFSINLLNAYANTLNTASDWAIDEILLANNKGLNNKIKDGIFDKDYKGNTTRGEFANFATTIYERLSETIEMSSDNRVYNNRFKDVPKSKQFVGKAYTYGIINGMSDDIFDLNRTLTREQLCTMLYRIKEKDISYKNSEPTKANFKQNYEDIDDISSWALDAVKFMNSEGIMKGRGTTLDPKGTATRQEAILMGYRLYNMLLSRQISLSVNEALPITNNKYYKNMARAIVYAENQPLFDDYDEKVFTAIYMYVNLVGDNRYVLEEDGKGTYHEFAYYKLNYDEMETIPNTMFNHDKRGFDDIFLLREQKSLDIFYQKINKNYYFFVGKDKNINSHTKIVKNIRDENYNTVGFEVQYSNNGKTNTYEVYFKERENHISSDEFYYEVSNVVKK